MNAKQLKKKQKANDMKCVESRFSFILLICTDSQLCDLKCTWAVMGAVLHWGCQEGCAALGLSRGLCCTGAVMGAVVQCLNPHMSIDLFSYPHRHLWKNTLLVQYCPITIQINVLYGQETCIYTIFNRPKGICTTRKSSGFWPKPE